MSKQRIQNFAEFWPYYVHEHSHAGCRALHFIGSTIVLILLGATIYLNNYWLLFALPVIGYGFAWFGHFVLEKNRPATFTYPVWSFIGDWKMWWLMLTGRMRPELERAAALSSKYK